jgi:hypothetical protein
MGGNLMVFPHIDPGAGSGLVSGTVTFNTTLMRMIGQEDFNANIRRKNFKSYGTVLLHSCLLRYFL